MKNQKNTLNIFTLTGALILGACSSTSPVAMSVSKSPVHFNTFADKTRSVAPSTLEDACEILNANPAWRQSFEDVHRRYNVPPALIMAFIYQESSFRAHAKASTSTAYGYAQALDGTWGEYVMETGNVTAKRSYMPDAVDFVGWYVSKNYIRTSVPLNNVEHQYLGYHEGSGGYLKQSYMKKPWLIKVAKKVNDRALHYQNNLNVCYYNG